MLEKIEGRQEKGWQRMRWWEDHVDSMDAVSLTQGHSEEQGKPGVLHSMAFQRVGADLATEQHQQCNAFAETQKCPLEAVHTGFISPSRKDDLL